MAGKSPLIILSAVRHGTHLLSALLESNGYRLGDEIVGRWWKDGVPVDEQAAISRLHAARRRLANDQHPASFIVHRGEWLRLWNAYYAQYYPELRVLRHLCTPQAAYVCLTRDPLKVAVSRWFMGRTHEVHRMDPDAQPPADDPPYDDAECRRELKKVVDGRWPDGMLQELGAITVDYEQLATDTRETLEAIARHVGFDLVSYEQHTYHRVTRRNKELYVRLLRESIAARPL